MFKFKFIISKEEFADFNKYHIMNSPQTEKNFKKWRKIAALAFFLISIIYLLTSIENRIMIVNSAIMLILMVLFLIFAKRLFSALLNRNIKKGIKDGTFSFKDIEVTYLFDEDKIYSNTDKSESKYDYSAVEKIILTEKVIYIYINNNTAYVLPLRIFEGEKQKSEFLDYIKSKTNIDISEKLA